MKLLIILASVLAVGLCMPGGWSVQDASDPQYMSILTDLQSNGKITAMNGSPTLVKVQTQVLSGMNYNFTLDIGGKQCYILCYIQSWTNTEVITEDTCSSNKRQVAGGYQTQDATDPKYQQLLDQFTAAGNLTLPANGNVEIVSVRTQVVAGINYEFTLKVNGHQCKFVYYEVSWMNKHEITSDSCSTLGHKRQLVGGWSKVTDTSDAGVQSCLGASLDRINMMSNSMYRMVDSNIISMEQQVVAGMKYRFKVQVSPSSCMNSDSSVGLTSVKCAVDANSMANPSVWDGECVYVAWQTPKATVLNINMNTDVDVSNGDQNKDKLLGGDCHDQVVHGQGLLGADGHDLLQHGKQLLGTDGHDLLEHGKQLLGTDGHDLLEHGKQLLGANGVDLVSHVKNLLGGDGHDMKVHGQKLMKLFGGDDHDMKVHGQKILGGDDHDMKVHGQKILGGDDHDKQVHGNQANSADCPAEMFAAFKKNHNKLYGSQKEEGKRYKIFCANMQRAKKFQQIEQGTARYGPTKFADLTKSEFRKYVSKKWDINAAKGMKKAVIPKGPVPESFDWRDHGAVTAVKNQGSCGSCWAFSTTGNIEGQWAIKKGKLISLSEQELVDCDKVDEGCNGGLPSNAYKEIERLGGLETETEYSYKGEDEKCEFKKKDVKVYINDSVSISSNETDMAAWLAVNGPISIGINAFAMQFYMGGISHPWSIFCNPSELDHGVLIVGYGVQGSKPYWIVKNSWGPDWGEKGYYLVYRGAGVCGLNTMCTSSVVSN